MQKLAEWILGISGLDAAVDFRGDLSDYARGSRNLLPDGQKQSRPFKGLQQIGAAGSGSRLMFQIKNSWGGLDDNLGTASGSLFSSIADMLVFVGRGRVRLQNTALADVTASAILKFLLKWNGSYTDPKSGPYTAGLPEPFAVAVGLVSGDLYGAPNLTGTVSIKYARLRKITGGRSRASETSAVLVVNNNAVYAVVPPAESGQDIHVFFGTDTKLGGIGLHYRIARANPFTDKEYTEEDVERQISGLTTSGTDILVAPAGTFTAGDIGKRVRAESGFTVPTPTTVAEIISDTEVRISNPFTLTSGTIAATFLAYAGGVDRSVVLNWKPSDLTEESAWIYDFPPPAASHAFQLENRMFVCSYADAQTLANPMAGTDADNPGTALVPSIPNNFESYDPRFPIYLPEEVVDILSDGMESYKFIGGRNGIYAAQFLNVDRAAPLTLTVLLRGEGIKSPNNWCARERAIYLFTGEAQPVRIIEGGVVDLTFAARVKPLMRNWVQENVVVSAHPSGGGGVVYSHGSESYFFDETTGRWSTELPLSDFAAGNIISSVATQSELIITLETGGTRTAYYFDKGAGSYVCGIGGYQENPAPQRQKVIQRFSASGVADRVDKTGWLGIHANTLPAFVKDGAIASGSNSFTSAGSAFTSELAGQYILIKGAGAGGGFLFGRILSTTPTTLTIGTPADDLADSVALNAPATVSGAFALIGQRIFPFKANRKGTFEIDSGEMFMAGFTSYAVSMLIETSGVNAQPLALSVEGFVNMEEGWSIGSANFNETT